MAKGQRDGRHRRAPAVTVVYWRHAISGGLATSVLVGGEDMLRPSRRTTSGPVGGLASSR